MGNIREVSSLFAVGMRSRFLVILAILLAHCAAHVAQYEMEFFQVTFDDFIVYLTKENGSSLKKRTAS